MHRYYSRRTADKELATCNLVRLNQPIHATKRRRPLTLRQRGSVEERVDEIIHGATRCHLHFPYVEQVDAFVGEVLAIAQDFQIVAVVESVLHATPCYLKSRQQYTIGATFSD